MACPKIFLIWKSANTILDLSCDGYVNVDEDNYKDTNWKINIEKLKEEDDEELKPFSKDSGARTADNENSPSNLHYENKPRMRICFDPEHEIPKLQSWFAENNHPSRLQVEEYVTILNALESRKGKKPLDINNVIYWFKNTRAAVKRAQAKHDRQILDPFYFQKMPHFYEGVDRWFILVCY